MNLERSTLERKDRAELATIAETLGKKPTSRSKKSDIVDLILELTGVSPTANRDAGDGPSHRAGGHAPESAAGDEEQGGRSTSERATSEARSVAEAAQDDASSPSAVADAPAADTPDLPDAPERESDQTSVRGDGAPAGTVPELAKPSDEREGGPNQPKQNRQGSNQGGQGNNQGNQNRQGNNQGEPGNQNNQGGDWDEQGNRRGRRRRGRNRDRQSGGGGGDIQVADENVQWEGEPVEVDGLLDLRDEGYGFLRVKGFLPSRDDVYVSVKQCRQLGLRKGDHLKGDARPAGRQEKNPALLRVETVNGMDPEQARKRARFEDLTPLFPDSKLKLEDSSTPLDMTSRIIDLISPIGKGQRGLIVSPPKAGKTTVMKTIAQSIERNNPEVHLIVLLVDERPEEVTDMRRSVQGEVVASTFDRPSDEHTTVAELTIERAKRLVEYGQDVVIILDGITRLSRAYNLAAPATGRIMSGGIDTGALYPPKKFFGAARNVEEGGSLTILATALVETGSKMDEVIFEEFKGTGNMELRLDRRMSEKRVYPAIDVDASSTRHEELLFERSQLQQVWKLRRVLSGLAAEGSAGASLELLIDRMRTFPTNDMFLAEIAKAPAVG